MAHAQAAFLIEQNVVHGDTTGADEEGMRAATPCFFDQTRNNDLADALSPFFTRDGKNLDLAFIAPADNCGCTLNTQEQEKPASS